MWLKSRYTWKKAVEADSISISTALRVFNKSRAKLVVAGQNFIYFANQKRIFPS
jgi:hypothetical protein